MLLEDWDTFLSWPTVKEALHSKLTPVAAKQLGDLPDEFLAAAAFPPFDNELGYTGTSTQQAWYVYQWEQFSGQSVQDLTWIHEFGGGYGAMALLCRRLGFDSVHTICDFPELHLLQEYFLSKMGVTAVKFVSHSTFRDPPGLYVALFSISEVVPHSRFIPEAKNYLIGYQPDWGWNNKKWFDEWRECRDYYEWTDYPNPHYENHRVLIGCMKDQNSGKCPNS
jgi:hypothetical protein